MHRLSRVTVFALAVLLAASAGRGEAACIDVRQSAPVVLEGTLTFHIFPGSPNFEDVRRGDAPEPTYVLQLNEPVCATGDDDLRPDVAIDRVQVFPDFSSPAQDELSGKLRRLVNRQVIVEGRQPFGPHTGHHHAPLLLPIVSVRPAPDPTAAYGTAMTTVQGFYLALAAGNGDEASRFVIPQKRAAGPLSAAAITSFYGGLSEPLRLLDVEPVGADEFRVRYTFVTGNGRRCDGASIVRTSRAAGGLNLISSIKALNGC